MDRSPSPDVLILGAGALGLCTAAVLAGRGARVHVIAPAGPNASSVAAGMLAPALEAAVDQPSTDQIALSRTARDLWPALADAVGLPLHREGAEWRGPDRDAIAERLAGYGFDVCRTAHGVFTADDWRIDPQLALKRLAGCEGLTLERGTARSVRSDGSVLLEDGRKVVAGRTVVAVGAISRIDAPPPLRRLLDLVTPIKGQILRLQAPPPAHVVRAPGVYVAPAGDETIVGATMETGRADEVVESSVSEHLLARAAALMPELAGARVAAAMAGVRGGSPDGLPMAGAGGADRIDVALAPRRNGWLLAPLVAQIVADRIEGRPPGPFAAALDARRFGS